MLNDPVNAVDPLGLWSIWGGGSTVAAWGPWGHNVGGGLAYDSENGGWGGYGTEGKVEGAAGSAGAEIGFFTGDMNGTTQSINIGFLGFSGGVMFNSEGDVGLVFGYAPGAPFEMTWGENKTEFVPFIEPNPCE